MVAGPSKWPDRNQKPPTATSTSTCGSTITVHVDVDVDVDVLVHVDVSLNSSKGVKHTPENVKLLLPPRRSRGIPRSIRQHAQNPGLARLPNGYPKRQFRPIAWARCPCHESMQSWQQEPLVGLYT